MLSAKKSVTAKCVKSRPTFKSGTARAIYSMETERVQVVSLQEPTSRESRSLFAPTERPTLRTVETSIAGKPEDSYGTR